MKIRIKLRSVFSVAQELLDQMAAAVDHCRRQFGGEAEKHAHFLIPTRTHPVS